MALFDSSSTTILMDEQTQARGPTAPFPEPPPFYKHFTKQNVSKLRELRKEAAKNRTEGTDEPEQGDIHVLSLPAELRFLVPPEPPSDGRYRSFGALHDVCRITLISLDIVHLADFETACSALPVARVCWRTPTVPCRSTRQRAL